MLFSSVTFLYYFLPCVLIAYAVVPKRWKNGALLLASLVFYAWGEPGYVFLMLAMVFGNYVCGLLLEKYHGSFYGKLLLWSSLGLNTGVLILFKYAGLSLALPVGISFYTFQLTSYLVDVSRGTVRAQKSFVDLAAYVTMFPQLIAGPIVRYADIGEQLQSRQTSLEKLRSGAERLIVGLGKKVLVADRLGELCEAVRSSGESSVLGLWMLAAGFSLQIYFDFSGYSDMATGLGRLFGFELMENFNYPYVSKSLTEFWRRWHISLGNWFRDYVYIPLGGNRVPKAKWYRNLFIVWALTGLWHGAAMNFVLWGLMFGVLLVVEKRWLLQKLDRARVWNHLYVVFWVMISFVLFQAPDLGSAFRDLAGMSGMRGLPAVSAESLYELRNYAGILVIAVIGATPLVKNITKIKWVQKMLPMLRPVLLAALFVSVTAYLIDGSFQPFLYFRF